MFPPGPSQPQDESQAQLDDGVRAAWLKSSLESLIAAVSDRAVNTHGKLGKKLVAALELSSRVWGPDPLPEDLASLAREVIPSLPVVFSNFEDPSEDDLRLWKVSEWLSQRCEAWVKNEKGKSVSPGPRSAAVAMIGQAMAMGRLPVVKGLLQAPGAPGQAISRFYWKPPKGAPERWGELIGETKAGANISLAGQATALGVIGFRNPLIQEVCDYVIALADPLAPVKKDGPCLLSMCMHSHHLESLLPRAIASGADIGHIKDCLLCSARLPSPQGMGHWFASLKRIAPDLARELAPQILASRLAPGYFSDPAGDQESKAMLDTWLDMMGHAGIDFLSTPITEEGECAATLLALAAGVSEGLVEKEQSKARLSPAQAWDRLAGAGKAPSDGRTGALWALWVGQHINPPPRGFSMAERVLFDARKKAGPSAEAAHFFQVPGLAGDIAEVCLERPIQALHGLVSLLHNDIGRKWSDDECIRMADAWARGTLKAGRVDKPEGLNRFLEKAHALAKTRMTLGVESIPADWMLVFSLVGLDSSSLEPSRRDMDLLRQGIEQWRGFDPLPDSVLALLEQSSMRCSLTDPMQETRPRPGRL